MNEDETKTEETPEGLLDWCRRKLAKQAADLVNKLGLPPLEVANLLLEAGDAVALTVITPGEYAKVLRHHADRLDQFEKEGGYLDA